MDFEAAIKRFKWVKNNLEERISKNWILDIKSNRIFRLAERASEKLKLNARKDTGESEWKNNSFATFIVQIKKCILTLNYSGEST